ncbi:DUF421 domain-containing protein [Halobacillus litoralis]|uniref:DUF421 domain-containing protein n=1 Tax=Halobacillus litoralis TaxID=45668 RepID=UPI001CFE0B4D|nr:DUF421 domain-containing protein [Halobacillus litoralis]
MEIVKDMLLVIARILTILPLLLTAGLFMGKRSIGELPVFDYLVILVLGSVVGADIADPKINHIHTVIAIITIALLQKFIIWLKLRHRKIGKMLTFEPTIVIYEGKMLDENVSRIRYSIDNITHMLREQKVFGIDTVELAIIEPNGQLSVKLKQEKEALTREDMSILNRGGGYDIPVILDGELQTDILNRTNFDQSWIQSALGDYAVSDIFYGAITSSGEFRFSIKGEKTDNLPPIKH